jgi:putative ABC transport system permease protein
MKESAVGSDGPPKIFLRLFRWYCHPKLRDAIEGDLAELYHEHVTASGKRIADLRFIVDVLLLFRPGIVRPFQHRQPFYNHGMFKNYFTTSWRNLISSKFYSGLNLLGLTLGLSVGLLILFWVNDELSFDSFHSKTDQIYRINVNLESSGNKFAVPVTQPTVAFYGLKEVPGIKQAVRVSDFSNYSVFRYQNTALKGNVTVYTDPSLFTLFDYKLLQGDIKNPFPVTESVILTQSAAKRFFGNEDPMGKVLVADNKDNFVVSGVVADFPGNTWLHCDMLFSTELTKKKYREWGWRPFDEEQWGNYGWITFLQLQPGTSVKAVEDQLTKINIKHQPTLKPVDIGYYTLQPLRDIHLFGSDGNPTGMQTVKIFSLVAFLILLIASINYVNLSTARAVLRAKEVSVRKIIGASRYQLFLQFIIQTLLFFTIALALSFVLISLVMPVYNELSGKSMHFDLFAPETWKVIGITFLATLLVSSIYPASLLSSFQPAQALRQKLSWGVGNASFRKVLVVCQFTFSVGLILATLIISHQLQYVLGKSLGYDKSHVFSVNMNNMGGHYEKVKAELLQQKVIAGVTSADNNIVNVPGASLDVDWDGKDPNRTIFVHSTKIDPDFLPLFNIPLVEGANFTGAATDSAHFILNETAVRETGIKDPIGKRFRLYSMEGTIIGVVKDFHFLSLKQKIEPFVFSYQPESSRLFVKASGTDIPAAIRAVEKIWTQYNEGFVFDYSFLDQVYEKNYQSEERTGRLFSIFTGVAIVISCLGLLGLATYTAQRKVKEIGIRKVLGASVRTLSLMLSKEFMVLVLIAIVIALPVSWFLMQQWLEDFAYRDNIGWWVVALTGIGTVLLAFGTVSIQAVRAALENPVKNLRSE